MRVCKVEGCGEKYRAKGLCRRHYRASRYAKDYATKRESRRRCPVKYRENLRRYSRTSGGRCTLAKHRARARGITWELSQETYAELVSNPCHWCGAALPPTGSGLDRLDNTLGYRADNVVPCCTQCNKERRLLTPAEYAAVWEFRRRHKKPA